MSTRTYGVTGLTCEHCVNAVQAEITALPGVHEVTVALDAGATSTVTVTAADDLTDAQLAAALDEAGDYHLA